MSSSHSHFDLNKNLSFLNFFFVSSERDAKTKEGPLFSSFFFSFFWRATGGVVNRGLGRKPKCWRILVLFFIYTAKSTFSIFTLSKMINLLEILAFLAKFRFTSKFRFYLKSTLEEKLSQENACENSKYRFVTPHLSMCASALCRFLCPTYAGMHRCTFSDAPVKPHHL